MLSVAPWSRLKTEELAASGAGGSATPPPLSAATRCGESTPPPEAVQVSGKVHFVGGKGAGGGPLVILLIRNPFFLTIEL